LQIQFLSADDGREDIANLFLVVGGKFLEGVEAIADFFQEKFFGFGALFPGEVGEVQGRGIFGQDAVTELLQRVEALGERDDIGIGDGIGSAGEEIGEADLGTDGAGERAQRQIERAGGSTEQLILRCGRRGHVRNCLHNSSINEAGGQGLFGLNRRELAVRFFGLFSVCFLPKSVSEKYSWRSCGGAGRLASLLLGPRFLANMLPRRASPSSPPRSQSHGRPIFQTSSWG
jgi:hypothetical protein